MRECERTLHNHWSLCRATKIAEANASNGGGGGSSSNNNAMQWSVRTATSKSLALTYCSAQPLHFKFKIVQNREFLLFALLSFPLSYNTNWTGSLWSPFFRAYYPSSNYTKAHAYSQMLNLIVITHLLALHFVRAGGGVQHPINDVWWLCVRIFIQFARFEPLSSAPRCSENWIWMNSLIHIIQLSDFLNPKYRRWVDG